MFCKVIFFSLFLHHLIAFFFVLVWFVISNIKYKTMVQEQKIHYKIKQQPLLWKKMDNVFERSMGWVGLNGLIITVEKIVNICENIMLQVTSRTTMYILCMNRAVLSLLSFLQDKSLYHPVSNSCMDSSPSERRVFMNTCDPSSLSQQWLFEKTNATVLEHFNRGANWGRWTLRLNVFQRKNTQHDDHLDQVNNTCIWPGFLGKQMVLSIIVKTLSTFLFAAF